MRFGPRQVNKAREREDLALMLKALRAKVLAHEELMRAKAPHYRSVEKQHLRLISAVNEIRTGAQNSDASEHEMQKIYSEACAVMTVEYMKNTQAQGTATPSVLTTSHFLLNLIR